MSQSPRFKPFNPREAVQIYRRNLPHWRQDGATYFVTFRLADSIPKSVLRQWSEERRTWYLAHGLEGTPSDAAWWEAYQRVDERERRAFEKVNRRRRQDCLDEGHGSCVLRDPACHQIVCESLRHFHGSRCATGDFVVMPNHVHLLVMPSVDHPLERILQSIKGFSSREIGKIGKKAAGTRLWQKENHDHIVRNAAALHAYRGYIRENPKKARLSSGQVAIHRASWLDAV